MPRAQFGELESSSRPYGYQDTRVSRRGSTEVSIIRIKASTALQIMCLTLDGGLLVCLGLNVPGCIAGEAL